MKIEIKYLIGTIKIVECLVFECYMKLYKPFLDLIIHNQF
jgi:hypothetical protein